MKKTYGEMLLIIVDELGTILAQPDSIVDRSSLICSQQGIESRATRRRSRDVRTNAYVHARDLIDLRTAR